MNSIKKTAIILVLAFVGWTLCGAIMGIGMTVTSLMNTLIIHAIGAAIIFALLSLLYFKKFSYTTPLQTAVIFTVFVVLMDIFVVSLLINKNFEMFKSILGTWLVFALIFISTYLTGRYVTK
jgi:hypothetical protein